ncbi:hypothetical protein CD29_10425 [Ureibacillus manganicus DSM 26584]|uniref:Uncharacterized protein n=1 Tax=Ureibacillus manganicus DSM 26584 TaxID=1384049 RepID=A0A0A3I0V1_9BACL|nr:hypothetical protein CD29_10425 [Ureibacillus manganicus DSM 26584]
MFKYIQNEKGSSFLLGILLLFVSLTFFSYYIQSYQSQINIYNQLEFVNVRATINLLAEINRN